YIYTWLVGYSSLLGAVGGILIADYFVLRRTRLDLPGLYRPGGQYWYTLGFNPVALGSLVAGITPCVPGFLATVTLADVHPLWTGLYHCAWFVSFAVAFGLYVVLTLLTGGRTAGKTTAAGEGA